MSEAPHRAGLAFDMGDEATARAVAAALSVEADEGPEGSRARVRQDGAAVHVEVEAGTVSDLRAAINSVVRLLDAAQRTAGVVRPAPGAGRNR